MLIWTRVRSSLRRWKVATDSLDRTLAPPDDAAARGLLDDLGLPGAPDTPDVLVDHQGRVVLLLHLLDAVHEVGPVLELRELVVDGLDVGADVDLLLDRQAASAAVPRRLLAALAHAGDLVGDPAYDVADLAALGQRALGERPGAAGVRDGRPDLVLDGLRPLGDRVLGSALRRLRGHRLEDLHRGLAHRGPELRHQRRVAAVGLRPGTGHLVLDLLVGSRLGRLLLERLLALGCLALRPLAPPADGLDRF
jgi:hypothetical protein